MADFHRLGPFHEVVALAGLQRMAGGVDADVRPDETVVADVHARLVEDGEVEVGEEVLADVDVFAVVAAEGLVELKALAVAAENAVEYPVATRLLGGAERVELPQQLARGFQFLNQVGMSGVVTLPAHHPAPDFFVAWSFHRIAVNSTKNIR